jgi:hypothetical protein
MTKPKIHVFTHKDKARVLKHALDNNQEKISLWKSEDGRWHAAYGPNNVPNWAVEVEHIR